MDQTAKRRSLRRSAGKWNRHQPAASDAELDALDRHATKADPSSHHLAAVARVAPHIMTWKAIRPGGRRSLAMLARKRMESITTRLPRAPRSSRLEAVADQSRHGYLRSHARVFPLRLDNGGCSPAVPASRGRTKQELTTPRHGAAKQHGQNLMRSRSDLCRKR
jgi:hypothetical protein